MTKYEFGKHMLDTESPDTASIAGILADDKIDNALFASANEVKTREYGNLVFVRGIIEFSNYCRCKCAYCGLNRCV